MQMWLCIKFLRIHAWKKACTSQSHKADVIAGPFNGHGFDFLIHGVSKPQAKSMSDNVADSGNTGNNNTGVGLTLDLLDKVFEDVLLLLPVFPPLQTAFPSNPEICSRQGDCKS